MQDLRAYALETVAHALRLELRSGDTPEITERAQSFIAIAEGYNVPVDELLKWIHIPADEKEWSLAEWRGWCALYVDMRRRLGKEPPQPRLFNDEAGAFDPK